MLADTRQFALFAEKELDCSGRSRHAIRHPVLEIQQRLWQTDHQLRRSFPCGLPGVYPVRGVLAFCSHPRDGDRYGASHVGHLGNIHANPSAAAGPGACVERTAALGECALAMEYAGQLDHRDNYDPDWHLCRIAVGADARSVYRETAQAPPGQDCPAVTCPGTGRKL